MASYTFTCKVNPLEAKRITKLLEYNFTQSSIRAGIKSDKEKRVQIALGTLDYRPRQSFKLDDGSTLVIPGDFE